MKTKLLALSSAALLVSGYLFAMPDRADLTQEAGRIAKQFAGTLKPELKHALENGGPTVAVEVCSSRAPAITQSLAAGTGWHVRRVSLKPRNPNAAPNDWESAALETLAERQEKNDGTDSLVFTELAEGEFRFLKAQPVEAICLTCHGTDIAPDVANALRTFYPHDEATGYSLGDIRGAISLTKPL